MSKLGDRIRHNKWGEGKILATKHGGYELFVQFDNGAISWMKNAECVPLTGIRDNDNQIEVNGPKLPKPDEPKDSQRLLSLQALEAFKLGIVPPFVKKFIFGRERQIEYFSNWFKDKKVNHALVFGGYGTGKTHFLNYLNEMSQESNYAVSICSIDPTEAPLYKPRDVYNKIVSNLTYGNGKKFEDFLQEVIKNKRLIDINQRNPFVANIFNRSFEEGYFIRWIRGENVTKSSEGFPTLTNYSTSANITSNLLSFYSYCFKEILGLEGLVLLFDEAESLEMPSYPYQQIGAINFFKGLRMTAEKDLKLIDEPKYKDYKLIGSKTDLIYDGRNPIDFLYNKKSALKVVFGFTPGDSIMRLCTVAGYTSYIGLDELNRSDKLDAIKAIQRIYNDSYKMNPEKLTIRLIEESILENYNLNIRGVVKRTIESMDILRHYGDKVIRDLIQ